MKLSDETQLLLENFASINSNLLVEVGNELKTISPTANIFAIANVGDVFEQEFGIFDLSQFLAIQSMFDDPEIDFQEKRLFIGEKADRIEFRYADPDLLSTPKKKFKMPPVAIRLEIDKDTLNKIIKTAAVLQVADLSIMSDGVTVNAVVHQKKNESSNKRSIELAKGDGTKYEMVFKIDALKMIRDDYVVEIAERIVSQWSSKNRDLKYWIALDTTSKYEG